ALNLRAISIRHCGLIRPGIEEVKRAHITQVGMKTRTNGETELSECQSPGWDFQELRKPRKGDSRGQYTAQPRKKSIQKYLQINRGVKVIARSDKDRPPAGPGPARGRPGAGPP